MMDMDLPSDAEPSNIRLCLRQSSHRVCVHHCSRGLEEKNMTGGDLPSTQAVTVTCRPTGTRIHAPAGRDTQ